MTTPELVARVLPWIAVVTYFLAAISQTFVTFKAKSAEGLSDTFLFLYLNTYIFFIGYIFCLDLPAPYKILEPISFGLVALIIGMRLWFSRTHPQTHRFRRVLGVNATIGGIFYGFAALDPFFFGNLAGWLAFAFDTLCQMPQVAKVQRTRSVHGFSFLYATCIAIANTSELIAAFLLKLPAQTVLMGIKAIIIYAIFIAQFLLFRSNQPIKKNHPHEHS